MHAVPGATSWKIARPRLQRPYCSSPLQTRVPSGTELHAAVPSFPGVVVGGGEAVAEGVTEGVIVTFDVGTLVKLEDSEVGDSVIGCVTVEDALPTGSVPFDGETVPEGYG